MEIIKVILITVLLIGIQWFLSTRKKGFWGLIIPLLTIGFGAWFIMYVAQPGTTKGWIFKFVLILGVNLEIYLEGRKKVENKKKKELEKMTIKDL